MTESHRVLVIGVGSIGKRHTRCFLQTGRATVSICEINDELRRQVGDEYNIARRYSDLDAALDDEHDAAVICTPANLHIPMALKLASRDISLLIEKPLSTCLDSIDQLRTLVAEKELPVAIAYVLRQHPVLVAIKDAIQSGRFGAPVQLVAYGGQHFPTYRPAYREIYYANHATGGGAIQDGLTHVLNAGEWLVGPIDELTADAAHQILEGVEVEDTAHVLTRQGRLLGSYSMNQHQACNESTITVICESGVVRAELHQQRWRWVAKPEQPWVTETIGEIPRDQLFVTQASAYLDRLEGKAAELCTLDDAEQTLRACLAALEAVGSREWKKITRRA